LAVVSRLKGEKSGNIADDRAMRSPVIYGDFLVSKVGNNFESTGKGKYD
jgi:hypothetical protein